MATSSISADVKAANSKLAQHMMQKEEEEMILQIGKRKPKQEKEKRQPSGRARWHLETDYSVPTPMVDRPRTLSGSTSFHFSFISVSKQAVPTVNGKPLPGSSGRREIALEHSIYIERDGAAEHSLGAKHAAYVERPNVIENSAAPFGQDANLAAINGTLTTDEAQLLGLPDTPLEGIPSVFSNISDDAFERQEFWRAVERTERTPRAHQIYLDPEVSPRWWAALPTATYIDQSFREHALLVAEMHRQWFAKPAPSTGQKSPFKAPPFAVGTERAGELIQQAMGMPGYDRSMPPVMFQSGRGGRVQMRLVAELPHELTAEDRALIVQNFCDKLGSLEERKDPDGTVRKIGMMYTAVIHAPDPHNDKRNYHLHVVAHDRPARYLDDRDQWDFEVQEVFQHKREDRIRFPFRQNKIGEIARSGNGAQYESSGKNFIPSLRREFAKITNSVLAARGVERRYDHRSYEEMGIDRTPTDHLGTKAAALEAIGVPTAVGKINAIAIWNDAERAISRQAKQTRKQYEAAQKGYIEALAQVVKLGPQTTHVPNLRSLIARHSETIKSLAEDREALMTFDLMEAKAKSRAKRTIQTCEQYLADIKNGNADGSTRILKPIIKQRLLEAQNHIAKIDRDLMPHRDILKTAADRIVSLERRVNLVDEQIKTAVETALTSLHARAEAEALASQTEAPAEVKTPAVKVVTEPQAAATISPPQPALKPLTSEPIEMPLEAKQTDEDGVELINASVPLKDVGAENVTAIAQDQEPVEASGPTQAKPISQDDQINPPIAGELEPSEPKDMSEQVANQTPPMAPDASTARVDVEVSPLAAIDPAPAPLEAPQAPVEVAAVEVPLSAEKSDVSAISEQEATRNIQGEQGEAAATDLSEGLDQAEVNSLPPEVLSEPMAAPLEPMAIEGVPIIKPTLAAPKITQAMLDKLKRTPKGLQPLRPELPPVLTPEAPSPTISLNGETPLGEEPKLDDEQSSSLPPVETQNASSAPKVKEQTLFPLEDQVAPVKPGTSQHEHKKWEDLFTKISQQRIPIVADHRDNGQTSFDVPSLNEVEHALLNVKRFATRTQARLKSIYEIQNREIERVVRWIKTEGQNDMALWIHERSARVIMGPMAIKKLIDHWRASPKIKQALLDESTRRIEIQQKLKRDYNDRLKRAAEMYPDPDKVFNMSVKIFTEKLRDLESPAALRYAAEQIRRDKWAREDIHNYSDHLSEAYNKIIGRDVSQFDEAHLLHQKFRDKNNERG